MVVIFGRPPVLDRVIAQVGLDAENAYFTYDGKIWSPTGRTPPDEIVEHEKKHVEQQTAAGGSDAWWDRWLADRAFRLDQEIRAYGRQIWWLRKHRGSKEAQRQLGWIAEMLAGDGYGRLTTEERARVRVLTHSNG